MAVPFHVVFAAGSSGTWKIDRIDSVVGDGLPWADRLEITESFESSVPSTSVWSLRGVTSNVRYSNRTELDALAAAQPRLGRADATCAALIPIRKSNAWWDLSQDERRAVFEEVSHHTKIGFEYLPAIARRLHHCRDIGEPFDFLTWFEYSPGDAALFETMVRRLRETPEWSFVEREIDIRLRLSK